MDGSSEQPQKNSISTGRKVRMFWHTILFAMDGMIDRVVENFKIIVKNLNLFLGLVFFITGLFGFESDKYCDGNVAEYLSCTRPSAYYYYNWLDITFLVVGAFLVAIWFLKKRETQEE